MVLLTKEHLLTFNFEAPSCGAIQNQLGEIRNIRRNPKSETSQFVTGIKWRELSPETEAIISRFIEMRTKDRRSEGRQLIRQ